MMPDLGSYAGEVSAAYGVGLLLLGALIATYWRRNAVVKRNLQAAEDKLDA